MGSMSWNVDSTWKKLLLLLQTCNYYPGIKKQWAISSLLSVSLLNCIVRLNRHSMRYLVAGAHMHPFSSGFPWSPSWDSAGLADQQTAILKIMVCYYSSWWCALQINSVMGQKLWAMHMGLKGCQWRCITLWLAVNLVNKDEMTV